MVTRIVFWNTQQLSVKLAREANKRLERLENERQGLRNRTARKKGRDSKPLTRGKRTAIRSSKKKRPLGIQKSSKIHVALRSESSQARDMDRLEDAQREANTFKNKLKYSQALRRDNKHAFYCEVIYNYPGWSTSMTPGATINGSTRCYFYSEDNTHKSLNLCPISDGNIPVPRNFINRYPKGILIGDIYFFLWHAPSPNNGAIVEEIFTSLSTSAWLTGKNFILLGDLNCEPHNVIARGIPSHMVLRANKPTHQCGKELDYAITNVPMRFKGKNCRKLWDVSAADIKEKTGSDHAPMILRMT